MAEREAAEHALYDAKLAAERANLSKTKFLAAASHDLLQPLHAARLFLGELRERAGEDARRTVGRVETALESAEHLISRLLEMSRLDGAAQSVEFADVRIDDVLRRLCDDYAPQAEEANLRFRLRSCDAVVRTDRHLLERLLRNLLSNALRYTARGGVVLGCRRRGERLRIEVWTRASEFPPSGSAKSRSSGASTCPDGPTAWAWAWRSSSASPGCSTCASRCAPASAAARPSPSRLPLWRGAPAALGKPPAALEEPALEPAPRSGETRRVLVIDDDAAALDGLVNVLRAWGMRSRRHHDLP